MHKLMARGTETQLLQLVMHCQMSLGVSYCHHPLTNLSLSWPPLFKLPNGLRAGGTTH